MEIQNNKKNFVEAKLINKRLCILNDGKVINPVKNEDCELSDLQIEFIDKIMKEANDIISRQKIEFFKKILEDTVRNEKFIWLLSPALKYIKKGYMYENNQLIDEFSEEEFNQEELSFISALIVLFRDDGINFINNINFIFDAEEKDKIEVDSIMDIVIRSNKLLNSVDKFEDAIDLATKKICQISYNIGNNLVISNVVLDDSGYFYGAEEKNKTSVVGKIIDNKYLVIYYLFDNTVKKYIGYYNGNSFVMNVCDSDIKTGFNIQFNPYPIDMMDRKTNLIRKMFLNTNPGQLLKCIKEIEEYDEPIDEYKVINARLGVKDAKELKLR